MVRTGSNQVWSWFITKLLEQARAARPMLVSAQTSALCTEQAGDFARRRDPIRVPARRRRPGAQGAVAAVILGELAWMAVKREVRDWLAFPGTPVPSLEKASHTVPAHPPGALQLLDVFPTPSAQPDQSPLRSVRLPSRPHAGLLYRRIGAGLLR